jgi:hypothetical protein
VRDAVKVALEVGVHDVGVPFLEILVDFPRRVFAFRAFPRFSGCLRGV